MYIIRPNLRCYSVWDTHKLHLTKGSQNVRWQSLTKTQCTIDLRRRPFIISAGCQGNWNNRSCIFFWLCPSGNKLNACMSDTESYVGKQEHGRRIVPSQPLSLGAFIFWRTYTRSVVRSICHLGATNLVGRNQSHSNFLQQSKAISFSQKIKQSNFVFLFLKKQFDTYMFQTWNVNVICTPHNTHSSRQRHMERCRTAQCRSAHIERCCRNFFNQIKPTKSSHVEDHANVCIQNACFIHPDF